MPVLFIKKCLQNESKYDIVMLVTALRQQIRNVIT